MVDTLQSYGRSSSSRDFEGFWRSLCGANLVPWRSDFTPAKARRFLGDIVLAEAPTPAIAAFCIRLTGQRFDAMIGTNLTGRNNLDFMPEKFRPGAVAAGRAIVEHPCGIWQISPAHLVLGYAMNLEITAFPLRPDHGGRPLILMHILAAGGLGSVSLPVDQGVGIGTAVTHDFIDVGAGIPRTSAAVAA